MNESAHTPAKSKILLVESHKKESVIIQPHLPAGDFDLVAVDGIELAVNAVLSGKPDLIFVSAEFASAGEKLEQLKQASRQCGSTLVLLSGGESNVDAAQYDDVVRTDTGNTELAHRLGNLVELKRARLELEWMKQRLKNDRKLLTKYFSEDIVEGILQDEHANSLSGRHQEATIMFFDVRRSTTIAENLEPQIFAEFLSEFFTDIMDLVYGNHGSVNKLLGDGIMSTFGCPVPTEHDVLNAAKCALQIRNHLATFNDVRPDYIKEPIKVGMGIATGKVFAGNIGSVRRMEYTVLGDPVNTASRLESMTKEAGVDILIDGNTRNRLGNLIKCRKVAHSGVRGKLQEIEIFSLDELVKR
jgi:adenylate cyclase